MEILFGIWIHSSFSSLNISPSCAHFHHLREKDGYSSRAAVSQLYGNVDHTVQIRHITQEKNNVAFNFSHESKGVLTLFLEMRYLN